MAFLHSREIGFKATGTTASVPDDPKAKLMYYLSCIATVLDLKDDPDINRLTRYRNYRSLSSADTRKLVEICSSLSPDRLDDNCIFQSDAMCGDRKNEFYEIDAVRNNLVVAGNITFGQRSRRVTKIMTYKRIWKSKFYTQPMSVLDQ